MRSHVSRLSEIDYSDFDTCDPAISGLYDYSRDHQRIQAEEQAKREVERQIDEFLQTAAAFSNTPLFRKGYRYMVAFTRHSSMREVIDWLCDYPAEAETPYNLGQRDLRRLDHRLLDVFEIEDRFVFLRHNTTMVEMRLFFGPAVERVLPVVRHDHGLHGYYRPRRTISGGHF